MWAFSILPLMLSTHMEYNANPLILDNSHWHKLQIHNNCFATFYFQECKAILSITKSEILRCAICIHCTVNIFIYLHTSIWEPSHHIKAEAFIIGSILPNAVLRLIVTTFCSSKSTALQRLQSYKKKTYLQFWCISSTSFCTVPRVVPDWLHPFGQHLASFDLSCL